jgi:UDP-2,4-diacetamido-2,4,6-trideoxy-beta-L-altropyranose hydrolase
MRILSKKKFSSKPTLVIRADATFNTGYGHIMRCLALAEAWKKRGGLCYFLVSQETGEHINFITGKEFPVKILQGPIGSAQDLIQSIGFLERKNADFVVLDGYHFNADFQKEIKKKGFLLLVLDDNQDYDYYYADIILNPNIHASETFYSHRDTRTRLLLGVDYFLIRSEFLLSRRENFISDRRPANLLVLMGGSDTKNITGQVLEMLNHDNFKTFFCAVIVGANNRHTESLEKMLPKLKFNAQILINPVPISGIMAKSDFAVSAAGVTSYELAFMGVPQANIVIAQNQKASAICLSQAGVSLYLGEMGEFSPRDVRSRLSKLLHSPNQLTSMTRRGQKLIDGNGPQRIVNAMMSLMKPGKGI